MHSTLASLIENKSLLLESQQPYAAILGLTPSKGARSPTLWNSAFQGLGINARMVPFDVQEKNLAPLVAFLKQDPHFLGGAVTMPFKTQILPFLDSIEPEALDAGAVNCLYKKNGALLGTNTDGLAARLTLEQAYGQSLQGAKVLLLGLGGAGSAVAAYVGHAIGKTGSLTLANRSRSSLEATKNRLESRCPTQSIPTWPVPVNLERFDIIINATSLGFEPPRQDEKGWFVPKFFTPLGPGPGDFRSSSLEEATLHYLQGAVAEISANLAQSLQFFDRQKTAFVYDLIYQPRETLFLSLARFSGCRVQNGLAMNLEQAVIAFDKATAAAGLRSANTAEVRRFMEST